MTVKLFIIFEGFPYFAIPLRAFLLCNVSVTGNLIFLICMFKETLALRQ